MVGRAYTVFGPDIYLNALEGVPPGAVWVQGACCPPSPSPPPPPAKLGEIEYLCCFFFCVGKI